MTCKESGAEAPRILIADTVPERMEVLKKHTGDIVKGKARAPFPEIVDNTMRCSFIKCQKEFFHSHLLCRAKSASNIHLVAGAAFADANDAFRKSYFKLESHESRDFELALARGAKALFKTYGYDTERESEDSWASSPKSAERVLDAFISYWKEFNPVSSHGRLYYIGDEPASECPFSFELDVLHPVTGKPLQYHIRFDCMEERSSSIWIVDDKTTTSLGASWASQWDTRSQFMGYVYGARLHGHKVTGVIARGTGILKTQIKHMEIPVRFSAHVIERWWQQVNRDFQRAVDAWVEGQFDYDYSDSCNAYGGCAFKDVCLSRFPVGNLKGMPIRIWNPQDPEQSLTWNPVS